MKRTYLAVLVATLTACASGGHSGGSAGGSSPAATNLIAFPLFEGASVLASRDWRQTVPARTNGPDKAVFAQGAGTYDGHDVIAGTQALMPALETWLGDLTANPPNGYSIGVRGNTIDSVRTHTRDLGFDFQVFYNEENGKKHGVVAIVVDPQTLDEKAGPMLGLIGRIKNMPPMLRDPVDAQVRRQTGFSLSEAANPDTPLGAVLASLGQLRDFGGRGIVLVDATKQ
jgi:hypothetical protein